MSVSASEILKAGTTLNAGIQASSVKATLQYLKILAERGVTSTRWRFVIGSRESELALIQSRHVKKILQNRYPDCEFVIQTSSSAGGMLNPE